jgi:Holliday junction resolvase-like predicted endonuclease
MNTVITGARAQAAIAADMQKILTLLGMALSPYEPVQATQVWMNFMRGAEEVINYQFALSSRLCERVYGYTFHSSEERLDDLAERIENELTEGAADRFHLVFTVLRQLSFPESCPDDDPDDGWALPGPLIFGVHAIAFLAHHRRHFVALSHTLPQACKGDEVIDERKLLMKLVFFAEQVGPACVALSSALMLSHFDLSFYAEINRGRLEVPTKYQTAMSNTLEPESLGIGDIAVEGVDSPGFAAQLKARDSLLEVNPRLVFSEPELLNQITTIRAAYSEFDLTGPSFESPANLIAAVLPRCRDHYWIELLPEELEQIALQAGMAKSDVPLIIGPQRTFVQHMNTYEPFWRVGDHLVATIPSLMRFIYTLRGSVLGKQRRYQIRAGFIFEDAVKKILEERGYTILPAKRIQRKEFDVIAIDREGGLVHFQVKNNRLDLTMLEEDPVLYARHCRRLLRYYERALRKEEGREHLLLERFGHESIKHYIVSKFPIPSSDPRILSLAQLHHL